MAKTITVDEDTLIAKIQDWLIEVDADTLAMVAGDMFGGECYYFADGYHFYPDENYCGAFGDAD